MPEIPITIACGNYDRVQAIKDGRVKVEGCAVNFLPLYPEEIFHRVFKFQEFDVSEMSCSSYIRTVAAGTSAYIGIPAFVSRLFRHSGIYVRKGAGIEQAGGPARQARRPARVPDHRGGLDARHAAARIRRAAHGHPMALRRPGAGRPRRAHAAEADRRPRPQADPARTRRWSACCATASSTRCSPRARRRRFSPASRTSRGCSPTPARPSSPTTRRPGCSRSCI